MDAVDLFKRHPRLSLALAGAGIAVVAAVVWSFLQHEDVEEEAVAEKDDSPVAAPPTQLSQQREHSRDASTESPPSNVDYSKLPPPQLCDMLAASDQLEVLAALRGLMAQSTFKALQDVTRSTGGLEKIASVAVQGPASSRVLGLEVLANYAPREENHAAITSGGLLDAVLQDLRRAASKTASVIDSAIGMSAARLLLNLASTDPGAQATVNVDLLRILLDHAADKRSPLRLPSLKVLRNVSVASLPRESLLLFGSCVVRSPLGIESTTKLRANANSGDECAALALTVLEKAKGARRAEGINQASTPDHLASPAPPTPPASQGMAVTELRLEGARVVYHAQEQDQQAAGHMEQVEQRSISPVSQATPATADDAFVLLGLSAQVSATERRQAQGKDGKEEEQADDDDGQAALVAPGPSTPPAATRSPGAPSTSLMSPLSPPAIPLTAAGRNRRALYDTVAKALPSTYAAEDDGEGEAQDTPLSKPHRELSFDNGLSASTPAENHAEPAGHRTRGNASGRQASRTLSQTTPLVAAAPGRQVTGVLPLQLSSSTSPPHAARPPTAPAPKGVAQATAHAPVPDLPLPLEDILRSTQANTQRTPGRATGRQASTAVQSSPSTSARSSPSGVRAGSGGGGGRGGTTTPGRTSASARSGGSEAATGGKKAGQSVRQQVVDKLKLGPGQY